MHGLSTTYQLKQIIKTTDEMSMDSCLCIWAPSASGKDSAGKTVSDSLSRPGEQQVRKSSG